MDTWKFIDQAIIRVRKLSSYSCVMELSSHENESKRQKQLYLYRSPGDVRIEQQGPFRKGAIVVIQSNGKIRAQGGGLLSFLKVDLSQNSSLLKGVTGDSAVSSDWCTILENVKKLKPFLVRSYCKPCTFISKTGYEMKIIVKNQPYEPYDEYRFLFREDGPLLLAERYRDGKVKTRIEWKKIKINPPTSDDDFKL